MIRKGLMVVAAASLLGLAGASASGLTMPEGGGKLQELVLPIKLNLQPAGQLQGGATGDSSSGFPQAEAPDPIGRWYRPGLVGPSRPMADGTPSPSDAVSPWSQIRPGLVGPGR